MTSRLLTYVLLAATLMLASCGAPRETTVESEPSGATVWVNGEVRGKTPLALMPELEAEIRVTLPGFDAWETTISGKWPAVLKAELLAPAELELVCKSRPSGAEVLLDGEYRGRTPLTIGDLRPGTYTLLVRADDRKPVTRSVELTESTTLDLLLYNQNVAIYHERIESDPPNLTNRADLAHEFVLEKRFDEAMTVIEGGLLRILEKKSVTEADRFWSEIDRILTMQFDYGGEEELRQARQKMVRMCETILLYYPKGNGDIYGLYALSLSMLGQADDALKVLAKAKELKLQSKLLQRAAREVARKR
jgi:tetratricopeptide (TPR) repeat protein